MNAVAEALVKILPEMGSFNDAVAKGIRNATKSVDSAIASVGDWGASVAEVGKSFKDVGGKMQDVGGSLTKNITKPAAGAAAVVGGLVAGLGFKRLVGIDTASAQFKSFGYDVDAVMSKVDAGVTNTSLSMVQGASIASAALATGNVPMEQLEAQIRRVGNVSAAWGVESQHAGNLLNQVLTKNKVTYGDLSQMQNNGIPIISELAKHYGVAGDEIMKMAQEGAISIEDLNSVIDNAAGPAAEEYANTWSGVLSNITANLGKLGAKMMEPTFEILKDKAAEFLEFLQSPEMAEALTNLGVSIGEFVEDAIGKISELISWWNGLSPAAQKTIGVFAGVAVAAGPVLKIVGSITSGIGTLITGFGKTVGVAASMGRGIKSGFETAQIASMYAMDGVKAFGSNVKIASMLAKDSAVAFAGQAKAVVLSSAAWVKNTAVMLAQKTALVASTVATKAAAVAQRAFNLAMSANPIGLIITAVAALVAALVWFFTQTELGQAIWANFTQFLSEAWTNLVNIGKAVWEGLSEFFTGLWDGIKETFTNVVAWVTDMFMTWHPLGIIISNWDAITAFFVSFWDGVKAFFAAAVQFVVDLFMDWTVYGLIIKHWDEISAFFSNLWTTIKAVFAVAVAAITGAVRSFLTGVQSVWNSIWSAVSGFFSSIWGSIVSAASGFFNSVKQKFNDVVNFVKGVPGKVLGFFSNIGSTLLNSGRALIQGFLDGIMGGFNKAKSFVSDGLAGIRSLFPFSPAKEGPFSGRGWVSYAGESVGTTFARSIASSLDDGTSGISKSLGGIEELFADAVLEASPEIGAAMYEGSAGVPTIPRYDAAIAGSAPDAASERDAAAGYTVNQNFYGQSPAAQVRELEWVLRFGAHAIPPEVPEAA